MEFLLHIFELGSENSENKATTETPVRRALCV